MLEVNRQYSGSCGENAWKAVEPTKKLFAAARAAGIPIIYTTRHADTNGVHSTNRQYLAAQEAAYEATDELAPMPGELVIYKERAPASSERHSSRISVASASRA